MLVQQTKYYYAIKMILVFSFYFGTEGEGDNRNLNNNALRAYFCPPALPILASVVCDMTEFSKSYRLRK